jgi:hypothetical protein
MLVGFTEELFAEYNFAHDPAPVEPETACSMALKIAKEVDQAELRSSLM